MSRILFTNGSIKILNNGQNGLYLFLSLSNAREKERDRVVTPKFDELLRDYYVRALQKKNSTEVSASGTSAYHTFAVHARRLGFNSRLGHERKVLWRVFPHSLSAS